MFYIQRKAIPDGSEEVDWNAKEEFGQYCVRPGHAVAQLVEALSYDPEGCGFDSRWCHWNFSLT